MNEIHTMHKDRPFGAHHHGDTRSCPQSLLPLGDIQRPWQPGSARVGEPMRIKAPLQRSGEILGDTTVGQTQNHMENKQQSTILHHRFQKYMQHN